VSIVSSRYNHWLHFTMSDWIEIVILSCLKTKQDYEFDPIEHSEMQPWCSECVDVCSIVMVVLHVFFLVKHCLCFVCRGGRTLHFVVYFYWLSYVLSPELNHCCPGGRKTLSSPHKQSSSGFTCTSRDICMLCLSYFHNSDILVEVIQFYCSVTGPCFTDA